MTTKTNPPAGTGGPKRHDHTGPPKNSDSVCESQRISLACLDSERAILGAILEDDDLIMPEVMASGLTSTDFFLSGNRCVYEVMVDQWQEHKPIDAILVTARLGNRAEDAALVASTIQGVIVHPDHILEHIEIVRNAARLRRFLHIGEWMMNSVRDTDNADALIEDAIQKLERISRPKVRA
jgi:replicative DNA helicase